MKNNILALIFFLVVFLASAPAQETNSQAALTPTVSTASNNDLAAHAASEDLPQISTSILRTQLQQETDPKKRPAIALRLAEILLTEGKPEEALTLLNSSDLTPQETDKLDEMVVFWKAQALLAQGASAEAQKLFEQILNAPRLPQVCRDATHIALARIARDHKEYDQALKELEPLSTTSSMGAVALQERVALLLALHRTGEAEELLQQKPELLKEPRLAYLFALAAWARGDASEALQRWSSLPLKNDWVSSATLSGMIACDIALHQPAQAQPLLEKYLQENPKSPRIPELMAQYEQLLLLQNSNDVSSLSRWSQDTSQPLRASYAFLPYTRMMRRLGHRDQADQLLLFFLATYPHHPLAEEASLELAENKLSEGDPNSALTYLHDHTNLTPAMQAQYAFEHGLAEIALNHLQAAEHDFTQAASLDSYLAADALYNQGLVHMMATSSETVPLSFPNTATDKQENASTTEKAEYTAILDSDKGTRNSAAQVIQAAHLFLKTHPNSPFTNEVRMKLGEALLTSGNVREARVELETVGKAESSSELGRQALLLAAQAASRSMDSKSIDDALMLLEEVAQSSKAGSDLWQARLEQAALKNAQALPFDAIAIDDQILASEEAPLEIKRTAQMAKGDTLSGLGAKDPANYQAAIAVWRQLAETPDTPAYWRNQALCKIGLIEEKLKDNDAALAAYYEAMKSNTSQEPEPLWHDKAAFEAARLLEQQQQWSEAIRLYQQIAAENGPRAAEAQARISKLRLDNFLWEK
ncbi:MAG: hypothetical protein K2W99_01735 [Chthoniobacterales bacterium]|nr:hypothetical protein [Chthoniobacterales bacterium]